MFLKYFLWPGNPRDGEQRHSGHAVPARERRAILTLAKRCAINYTIMTAGGNVCGQKNSTIADERANNRSQRRKKHGTCAGLGGYQR